MTVEQPSNPHFLEEQPPVEGNVEIITPEQEQLVELERARQEVNQAKGNLARIEGAIGVSSESERHVDEAVAKFVGDGLEACDDDPECSRQTALIGVAEVSKEGSQPNTAAKLNSARLDVLGGALRTAEMAGVDMGEVIKDLDEAYNDSNIGTPPVEITKRRSDVLPRANSYLEGALGEKLKAYKEEVGTLLEISTENRVGTGVIDGEGIVRKPIIDLELSDDSLDSVRKSIELRNVGLGKLEKLLDSESDMSSEELFNRANSILLECDFIRPRGGGSELGTVADLYISPQDISRMHTIERKLKDKSRVYSLNLVSQHVDRIVDLPRSMFCSGSVMMHATPHDSWQSIQKAGGLLPRSMQSAEGKKIKSGNTTEEGYGVTGGFVHFCADSTVAEEYGGDDKSLFGIQIDTIVKKTPYLFLEPGLMVADNGKMTGTANLDSRKHYSYKDGMMGVAQKIGKVRLGANGGDVPIFVRDRITESVRRGEEGLANTDIKQGRRNNFTFGASMDKHAAAAYEYDLDDMVYKEEHAGRSGNNLRVSVREDVVYMPVEYSQIDFSEQSPELNEVGTAKYQRTLDNLSHFTRRYVRGHVTEFMHSGPPDRAFAELAQYANFSGELTGGALDVSDSAKLADYLVDELGASYCLRNLSEIGDGEPWVDVSKFHIVSKHLESMLEMGESYDSIAQEALDSINGREESVSTSYTGMLLSSEGVYPGMDKLKRNLVEKIRELPEDKRNTIIVNMIPATYTLEGHVLSEYEVLERAKLPFTDKEMQEATAWHERKRQAELTKALHHENNYTAPGYMEY